MPRVAGENRNKTPSDNLQHVLSKKGSASAHKCVGDAATLDDANL